MEVEQDALGGITSQGDGLGTDLAPLFMDDDDNTLVNVQSDISDEFDGATFWPFSTSWQWTHEDLYLQGDGILSMDLGVSDGMPPELQVNAMQGFDGQDLVCTSEAVPGNASSFDHLLVGPPSNVQAELSMSTIVDRMVEAACKDSHLRMDGRPSQWMTLSKDLSRLVIGPDAKDEMFLHRLVEQYFDNFHPLWATFPRESSIASSELHPLLYLTATSIGALYSGTPAAASYGAIMHKKIRNVLPHETSQTDLTESKALDLGRALLLTQVAALYFEHDNAFSAAQHLSATQGSHVHRMRLFDLKSSDVLSQVSGRNRKSAVLLEGRKMLAFGILRAETFMSILFNKKPLISSEEVNLPLPFAQGKPDLSSGGASTPNTRTTLPCGGLLFSDLIRIALDEEEILPPLRPFELELVLFGLQHEVWRFSHDPNVFLRLIQAPAAPPRASSSAGIGEADPLDFTCRSMRGLTNDFHRVTAALQKWKNALSRCQLSHPPEENRTTYLSSLILHELSSLRLCAPLDAIQQTAYQLHEPSASNQQVVSSIFQWATQASSHNAVKHAKSIWQMLARESSRPPASQAKYNILALIALHHAAVVVWAIAGTQQHVDERFVPKAFNAHPNEDHNTNQGLPLRRENTKQLMAQFADLYPSITSSWGMQSSFHKMVRKLAEYSFPNDELTY
jgi:hypothetical protein